MERIVDDYMVEHPAESVTPGFVGNVICWLSGLGLVVVAIAFSYTGSLTTKVCGMMVIMLGAIICGWARTANARWKLRLSAAVISTAFMLLFSEAALRLFTNYPVSRSSNIVSHEQLGYVLDPSMGDVDANGFRNRAVPETVDIVAIGDSHTQGFNVDSHESWPAQLAGQLKQSVYNMGVGGYGPLHYDQLIDQALAMKPKQIVIGLYLGNDLADVRQPIQSATEEDRIDNRFRHVLKYNSAVGSLVTQTLKRSVIGQPIGFSVNHAANPTHIAKARISHQASINNSEAPETKAAISETVRILMSAAQRCHQQGVRLVVALIPTRESVYHENMKAKPTKVTPVLEQVAKMETDLRGHLVTTLQATGIPVVDLLPSLSAALDVKTEMYPRYDNGHPLANGYATYAAAIGQVLAGTSTANNVMTN